MSLDKRLVLVVMLVVRTLKGLDQVNGSIEVKLALRGGE